MVPLCPHFGGGPCLFSKSARSHARLASLALTAAVLGAAFVPVWAQEVAPREPPVRVLPGGGIPVPALIALPPAPPAPAADATDTGRPEDPATPPGSGDVEQLLPGDLMSSSTAIYVDDSFASVDKLRKAIDFARKGQAQLAINTFQDIVSNYGQKLVLLNDNSYVSITDYVRERLLQMPAVKNGMYDQLFGSDARRDIDAAVEIRDVATLIRMCDRYFPSTAALKGLDLAAQWYFERGEFSAAAQTWRQLLTHPLAGTRVPEFLFRASLAQHLARDDAAAGKFRDRLQHDFPDAKGTVAGKDVTLLTRLDELLARGAWEKVDINGDEWPAFAGGPSRSALLKTQASIGARLWSIPLSGNPSLASAIGEWGGDMPLQAFQGGVAINVGISTSAGLGSPLSSHPVLSNGQLFVHLGGRIVCLSANAGTYLWSYPQANAAGNVPAAINQPGYVGDLGLRLASHNSVAVYGDQVFAIMSAGGSGSLSATNERLLRSSYNTSAYAPTSLVCLSRDDGHTVWSLDAKQVNLEKEGLLTFVGAPVVTRQGIFIMARKSGDRSFTQQYLVRVDRETGTPTWNCYICSTSTPNNGQIMQANVPIPTLVDDVLYVSTGQGADCAIDANAGRILWLRATSDKKDSTLSRRLESWQDNPPVIVGDKMVTTDTAQKMRIYNRWTGHLLKTLSVADLPGSNGVPYIDVLAGAVGSKIIFSARNVSYCYDIEELAKERNDPRDQPQPLWCATISANTAGAPSGRPFLTSTGYYVPFGRQLARIDLATGISVMQDWLKNDKEEPGAPGNLLVTSEQVIVVNDHEIAGYSKWETARDNRLARIKAHPRDPAAFLDLAEVSFRTEHQDLAQENMKKAIDLANSGAAPAGANRTPKSSGGSTSRISPLPSKCSPASKPTSATSPASTSNSAGPPPAPPSSRPNGVCAFPPCRLSSPSPMKPSRCFPKSSPILRCAPRVSAIPKTAACKAPAPPPKNASRTPSPATASPSINASKPRPPPSPNAPSPPRMPPPSSRSLMAIPTPMPHSPPPPPWRRSTRTGRIGKMPAASSGGLSRGSTATPRPRPSPILRL